MKICMLIRRHSFLDARVFEKEARSLAAMGHHVTITAPKHKGHLLSISRTPILDKAFRTVTFVHEGVNFVSYNANKIAGKKQVARMQQRMIRNIKYRVQTYFVDPLRTVALRDKADIYHAHEWETLYEAIQIKRILKKQNCTVKVIFDAHELEKHTPLLKLLMREVDHIITVSDSLKNIYARRYPKIPITVIYNSPHFQEYEPVSQDTEEQQPDASKPFTIAYEGMLSKDKGDPYKIMEIVNRLSKVRMEVKFKILGKVALVKQLEMKKVIRNLRLNPRIHYGWVDFQDLSKHWAEADAGYVYFNLNEPNRVYALPNKFFSYLNNGVPVVVNAATEMWRFVNKHQCGIVIKKKNPTAADYADHFIRLNKDRELLNRLSRNAREVMQTTYCWERMEERLADMMNSLQK